LGTSNYKIGIMASGRGTNAENLIRYGMTLPNVEIKVLACDMTDAPVLELAQELGIPSLCLPLQKVGDKKESKKAQEETIIKVMDEYGVNWIFLAGYMRILGPTFLNHFGSDKRARIVNIHPSLLPSFPGKDGYKEAFDYGVKVSGATTHFVSQAVDAGEIILQESFPRLAEDTFEDFTTRGLKIEHQLYRKTLDLLSRGDLDQMRIG